MGLDAMASNDEKRMYRWVLGENLVRFRAELTRTSDPGRCASLEQLVHELVKALEELDLDKIEDQKR
jgi:hypothetical protein